LNYYLVEGEIMKIHWTTAALLSSALIVGCGDRGADKSSNSEETNAVPPAGTVIVDDRAAVPETSARVDDSANRDTRPAAPRVETRTPARPRAANPSTDLGAAPESPSTNVVGETVDRPARNAAAPARLPVWRDVTVTAGTALPLELMTELSSETAQVEAPVRARLRQDVIVDGYTVLPAGSIVSGTVTDVERPGRVQGRARLAFRFNDVQLNGGREDLRTNPVSFEGEATKGEDATKIGAGAGIGAVIGGIVGGKSGAAKGGAIGGAAGTGAVLATRGRDVVVANGTDITATLAQPSTIRVQTR
jgi:hypothetical protein